MSSTNVKGRGQKSLIVTLHLPRNALSRFSSDDEVDESKLESKTTPSMKDADDKSSESNTALATSNGADDDSSTPVKPASGKKKSGGTASGRKRAPPMIDPNGPMKERGRPGPKKKPKQADGAVERNIEGDPIVAKPTVPGAAHKLGPKANTGAINAGLRALDRSGKPCRKWERKGLQLKSFTGIQWGTSTWKSPSRDTGFSGDVKSDSGGSSDLKPHDSSVVASERSQSHVDGDIVMTNGIDTTVVASSPAPIAT